MYESVQLSTFLQVSTKHSDFPIFVLSRLIVWHSSSAKSSIKVLSLTLYIRFPLLGVTATTTGFFIPSRWSTAFLVATVAVAVKAITLTCLGMRLRTSPKCANSTLNSSPLHVHKKTDSHYHHALLYIWYMCTRTSKNCSRLLENGHAMREYMY